MSMIDMVKGVPNKRDSPMESLKGHGDDFDQILLFTMFKKCNYQMKFAS